MPHPVAQGSWESPLRAGPGDMLGHNLLATRLPFACCHGSDIAPICTARSTTGRLELVVAARKPHTGRQELTAASDNPSPMPECDARQAGLSGGSRPMPIGAIAHDLVCGLASKIRSYRGWGSTTLFASGSRWCSMHRWRPSTYKPGPRVRTSGTTVPINDLCSGAGPAWVVRATATR